MENGTDYTSNSNHDFDSLNIDIMIDLSRDLIEKDIKASELLINTLLTLDLHQCHYFTVLGIKDYIACKNQNQQILLRICRKFLKKKNLISASNVITFIRVLFRAGNVLFENEKIFLSAYCFYHALNVIEMKLTENSHDSLDTINKKIIKLNPELTNQIEKKEKEFSHNKDLNLKLEEFRRNINKIKVLKIEKEKSYYIVSLNWITNLLNFIYCKEEGRFEISNVLRLYLGEESNNNLEGAYPGPINNFNLLSFNEIWYDPHPAFSQSNIPLAKNLKENVDYIILDKENYQFIKDTFGVYFEIERNSISNTEEIIVEVQYFRLKVLVYTSMLLDEYKNHISIKSIYFPRQESIKFLKEKVFRCLNHLFKKDDTFSEDSHDVQIIMPTFKNRHKEIYDILSAITNGNQTIFLEGNFVEEETVSIQDSKIPNNGYMIIEIKEKGQKNDWIVKLKDIEKKCSYCLKRITTQEVDCKLCNKYLYCSTECQKGDISHRNYHKKIENFYMKKINLTKIRKNSRKGLTGLRNLGNTCFMNSAIQCLSHTEDLTKYFLLKCCENEINTHSINGTKGQMANAYYDLVNELWNGSNSSLSPWDFRQIFIRFAKQFSGFSQHDSHEMLTFVLDGLHEDLNRVKSKPYLQLTEKLSNETDEEAAKRWWDVHIKRENSIIVDLFHGQYKSTITCPECKMISLTYDPFMHLGVPIPSALGATSIKIKYFLIDSTKYKVIETDVSDSTLVGDVMKKIQENEKNRLHLVPVCVSIKDDLSFKKVLKENDSLLKFYKRRCEVVFYEIDENIEELEVFTFISPAYLVKSSQYLIFNQYNYRAFFYPRPFFFTRSSTIRDLYIQVFKCFLPFFEDHYLKSLKLLKNKENLEEEISSFFNKKDKSPFTLFFKNNRKEIRPWYYPFNDKCEFCGKNCKFCELKYKEDNNLTDFTNKLRSERELLMLCVIKTEESINNSDFNDMLRDSDLLSLSEKVISTKESVNNVCTLNDCLESFRKEERLEKENSWYCPTCKKHQEAFKKMEIYRSPKVLIIQIKRFKLKETNSFFSSSYQNKKNDCFIEYPVNTLDLGPYICGPKTDGNKYELFAISQHYGSLSSGHYTALCKNRGKWYSFDDESVSRADEKQVVNKAAYLLFYRRISE